MKLDRSRFVAWLKGKPPTEVVGEQRDCHSCPLANFYEEASGGCEVVIFDRWGEHYIDRGYSTRRLPDWAADFVHDVDGEDDARITAHRALQLLGVST